MTTIQQINHLSWRAGFGFHPSAWEKVQSRSLEDAVKYLFRGQKNTVTLLTNQTSTRQSAIHDSSEEDQNEARMLEKQSVMQQNAQWIARMADPSEDTFLERMTLFWHGHFACRITLGDLATAQLNTFRQHALGNFKDLVLAVAKDVAMIRYLNNQQNKKRSPNENFARELMELFTIGRENYSEQDIKEAARAFTGWSSNLEGKFVFRPYEHDYGSKTFMGKKGDFDGGDIIDIILAREETALFLVTKIYRYFVNETIDEMMVKTLAKQFYQSNYNIAQLMRTIFESDWFYAPKNIGTKIKSPVELIAGVMRTLEVEFSSPFPLIRIQKTLGQTLFDPPNVAGWKGGNAWIDNATLMIRLNLANGFIALSEKRNTKQEDQETQELMDEAQASKIARLGNVKLNFQPLLQTLENQDKDTIFETLSHFLLQPQLRWNKKTLSHTFQIPVMKTISRP
ncbi:MAG: DUF1800 domain-containing protein [Saprospiraceae bacterium]|nr:DUF1800 domain-containing protein [Saprospiraceae bacterium]